MILGNRLRQRLLAHFFACPGEGFHVREIALQVQEDPGNVSRELRRLEQEAVCRSQVRGRLRIYSLNEAHPFFKELKTMILKTSGVEALLKAALEKIKGVRRAFLFGSYARGQMDVHSDLDLCVIGSHETVALNKAVAGVQRQLKREINLISLGEAEYASRIKKDPFLKRLQKDKKVILV